MTKLEVLKEKFFGVSKGESVLEIGSANGRYTEEIVELAKDVVCVEPDDSYLSNGIYSNKKVSVFNQTILDYYSDKNNKFDFDVVYCMGVLYHSHSPLMILDKIITLSKPKHIIIDTFQPSNRERAKEEGIFCLGKERRNIKTSMMGWDDQDCSLPFVLSTNSNTWKNILDMCGYKCKEEYDDKRTTCILTTKEL
tara:strand:- start:89 stop:673 length:585 start_codon:yes stop_codon:yes gene_type:complete